MVDYSRWKDIEISDDEDDTHPNIDTPSLFRWRHQARVQRMEEQELEKKKVEEAKAEHDRKLKEAKEKLEKAKKSGTSDVAKLAESVSVLEVEEKKLKEQEEELKKKEKITPWNVDTISKSGFSKTVINNPPKRVQEEELSEEKKGQRMKEFFAKYDSELKKYSMLQRYDDSKRFLTEHPHLVCDDTAHYLVVYCINLEMEKKHSLMEHVAHQCICMQYILELSKKLDVDPRACVSSFFSRIQAAEVEYRAAFEDELRSFKQRICLRAEQKLELAIKEAEEEDRKARLGPGGLDPVDVFDSLPKELQECFESQDIAQLQTVMGNMEENLARKYLKMCIDSGLWIPEANKKTGESEASEDKLEEAVLDVMEAQTKEES